MGMFDYVKFKANCYKCKELIENEEDGETPEWQTKDSDCHLDILEPENEDVEEFYAICPHCKAWNEYKKQNRYVLVKKYE